jgi:hypothetical protein
MSLHAFYMPLVLIKCEEKRKVTSEELEDATPKGCADKESDWGLPAGASATQSGAA